jgi:pre-rRNA-processing protein TSR4
VRAFRAIRASAISAASEKSKQPKKEQTPQETPAPAAPKTNLGESLFGVKPPTSSSATINPFSTGGSASRPANPFSSAPASSPSAPTPAPAPAPTQPTQSLSETFATKARISTSEPTPATPTGPREPWPQQSSFPSPYPSYYLDADYETLDAEKPDIPAQTRVDMDIDAGEGGSGDMDVKDAFESSMDKAFQRFADRMSQNPEQILRYEFAGSPLLYSKIDPVGKLLAPHQESGAAANVKVKTASAGKSGMPKCVNCGGDRLFELQLTPYAIVELEAEELGLEGMEWGTIILGVCSKDCVQRGQKEGEVGYVEEWVGVQWEELNKK